jgi:hypothetical protein
MVTSLRALGGTDDAQRWFARARELAMSVQHVLDLPPKIGRNIIASLIEPHFDHPSCVVSIPLCGGWINGKCGQCLESIEGVPPG